MLISIVSSVKDNQMPWEKKLHAKYKFKWVRLDQEYVKLNNEDLIIAGQGKDITKLNVIWW